ncbi:efflux RND transporter periplasmic adaptor subunit [Rhodopirellula baltica]|uniref:Membrane-fusion protein n=1 Tax=Rhodopirellula baltica SWK14 TaxID=993516 RepID=L7CAD5_RHOBT|nr:HlyD family efflux transporter periplasmic adaptor subunit [Rhodopirellula baltica]ELP31169.1 membrane-fusion protein [Rhodopirellula baltica SWK14]
MNDRLSFPLRLIPRFAILVGLVIATGCAPEEEVKFEKAPRPVEVMTLTQSVPVSSYTASGSVQSWKTEDIGFEVGGKVSWVLEPGENIDGRVIDVDGKMVQHGTPLAQIEPERYEIAVESAVADLEVAKLNKESIEIRLKESLPAEMESARANLSLAEMEFSRIENLKQQNAASKSEYDQARNLVQTRLASLSGLLATEKQTRAELKSAESQIRRAEQTLRDAQRDLEHTTLYGSYQGQISGVNVVPGSVVNAGDPVLTLQMTNPIKVEVELSAKQSRSMRRRHQLPTTYALPDGTQRNTNAFVYNVDASADPDTRTFTMTLLLLNERLRDPLPGDLPEDKVARSEDLWPLRLNRMMGTSDKVVLVEEESIHHDNQGAYIYLVTNSKLRERLPDVVKVRRQRLVENELKIPFLGNWVFRSVQMLDDSGEPIDIDLDSLYVGGFVGDPNADSPNATGGGTPPQNWDGESIVLDPGSEWMLRPGELVSVDLADQNEKKGFFVPFDAIDEEAGQAFLYVVKDNRASKVAVDVISRDNLDLGSMIEIQSPELSEGMLVIVRGVHFLSDGEKVRKVGAARRLDELEEGHLPGNPMPPMVVEGAAE